MKRTVSVRCGDYELKVEEFDNWIGAISELVLGSIVMEIASIVGHDVMYDSAAPLQLPEGILTAKELIVCALLLRYPEGLSKEDLQSSIGMKPDSLGTYLTSKQKGLADGLKKTENDYSIKAEMIGWAIDIASVAINKYKEKISK